MVTTTSYAGGCVHLFMKEKNVRGKRRKEIIDRAKQIASQKMGKEAMQVKKYSEADGAFMMNLMDARSVVEGADIERLIDLEEMEIEEL